jgi:hypothetical protein
VIDRAVILHGGVSKPLRKELERRGFDLYELDLSEFLKFRIPQSGGIGEMPRPSDDSLSVPGDHGNRHWQEKVL